MRFLAPGDEKRQPSTVYFDVSLTSGGDQLLVKSFSHNFHANSSFKLDQFFHLTDKLKSVDVKLKVFQAAASNVATANVSPPQGAHEDIAKPPIVQDDEKEMDDAVLELQRKQELEKIMELPKKPSKAIVTFEEDDVSHEDNENGADNEVSEATDVRKSGSSERGMMQEQKHQQ